MYVNIKKNIGYFLISRFRKSQNASSIYVFD